MRHAWKVIKYEASKNRGGTMRPNFLKLPVLAFIAYAFAQNVNAQGPDVSGLALPDGPVQANVLPQAMTAGDIEVVVQLSDPPLAVASGRNAKQQGSRLNAAQQRAYLDQLG